MATRRVGADPKIVLVDGPCASPVPFDHIGGGKPSLRFPAPRAMHTVEYRLSGRRPDGVHEYVVGGK